MALSELQEETLNYIFDTIQTDRAGVLSDWERSFMADQKSRYDQYGKETRFSDKQWAIVEKVESALVDGKPNTRGRR